MRSALLALLILAAPARAGVYYSGEIIAELPAQWRGFLPDHRTLRTLAAPAVANPLRDSYAAGRCGRTRPATRPLAAGRWAAPVATWRTGQGPRRHAHRRRDPGRLRLRVRDGRPGAAAPPPGVPGRGRRSGENRSHSPRRRRIPL